MPRSAIFHETSPAAGDRVILRPIDKATSELAYLLNDVKKMQDFRITSTTVPERFVFDVLISKHVVPFYIAPPAHGLLPFERDGKGEWRAVPASLLAASRPAKAAFDEILRELSRVEGHPVTVVDYFNAVDTRLKKLQAQLFDNGYLVVFGAGGTFVTAAYAPVSDFEANQLIVDQTLYWTTVPTEDEALYLVGLFNSPALDHVIAEFQPSGQFGRRHIHELPLHATPGFDATNAAHVAVVGATRALIKDYSPVRDDASYSRYFTPGGSLASRRRELRTEILPRLPSCAAYVAACAAIYAPGQGSVGID